MNKDVKTIKVDVNTFVNEMYRCDVTTQTILSRNSYGERYHEKEWVFYDITFKQFKNAFLEILEKLNKGEEEAISRETALLMAILHGGKYEEIYPSTYNFKAPTPIWVRYFLEDNGGEIPLEFSFVPWNWNWEWDWKREESLPKPTIYFDVDGWKTTEPKAFKRLCEHYGIEEELFEQLFKPIAAQINKHYIGDKFSPLMLKYPSRTRVEITKCEREEEIPLSAKSVIGHADTALRLSSVLGRDIPFNNETTKLEWGDTLYIPQFEGDNVSLLKVEVMDRW